MQALPVVSVDPCAAAASGAGCRGPGLVEAGGAAGPAGPPALIVQALGGCRGVRQAVGLSCLCWGLNYLVQMQILWWLDSVVRLG